MDVFLGPRGFILTYPMSNGRDCNILTAFAKDDFCTKREEVDVNKFQSYWKDYHSTVQAVIKLVNYTQRWALLQMPRMESWSNPKKNVVLLGDAVHFMQSTMAQGLLGQWRMWRS
jgi:salicylate hydroxylase